MAELKWKIFPNPSFCAGIPFPSWKWECDCGEYGESETFLDTQIEAQRHQLFKHYKYTGRITDHDSWTGNR